jgi:hypothetical protein
MDFLRISNSHILLKLQLFTKAPGTFSKFTTMPLLRTKHPGNNSDLAMWPLGAVAGVARRNPASSPVSAAGRGRGKGPHSPRVRFRGSAGSGRGPARGRTGGRRWWPPRAVPGCGRGSTGMARGHGSGPRESWIGSCAAWSRSAWREELTGRCPGRTMVRGEVRSSSGRAPTLL